MITIGTHPISGLCVLEEHQEKLPKSLRYKIKRMAQVLPWFYLFLLIGEEQAKIYGNG